MSRIGGGEDSFPANPRGAARKHRRAAAAAAATTTAIAAAAVEVVAAGGRLEEGSIAALAPPQGLLGGLHAGPLLLPAAAVAVAVARSR